MATKLQEIEAQAMRLGPKSRAKLAERIILSLDGPMDTQLERIWVEEAKRRIDEIRKGQAKLYPAAAVLRRVRRQIARRESHSTL